MQHKTKSRKKDPEKKTQQASKENMILKGTQGRINTVEHSDVFKVENVARILSGKISFPKPNQLKYFQFIFPQKPKITERLEFFSLAELMLQI